MSGSEISVAPELGFGDPNTMRYILSLPVFAALALGQQTLTCTFQFTGSGTLGTSAFTSAAITITTVGNTANRYITSNGSFIRNDSTSIFISGLGTSQFLVPSEVSNVVFGGTGTGAAISLTDTNNNAFVEAYNGQMTWDMLTSLGPLTLSGNLSPFSVPRAITSGGTMTLNVAVLPVTFRAAIATPDQPYAAIAAVTNAALAGLDIPISFPSFPIFPTSIHFAPRSIATIFGTNLANSTVSSTSPWSSTLGGTEVHLVSDACSDPSCDLIAKLIYVSSTQINLLVPEDSEAPDAAPIGYRIVFVQNGRRIDNRYSQGSPGYPGYLYLDSFHSADYNVVFQVGYDCLFSTSPSDPGACGLSWSQGTGRAPLGAITDAVTGHLISSGNPVHQGQLLTLWTTGFQGGATLSADGLLTANNFPTISFGVAASGIVLTRSFPSPAPLWAGESPQFAGLDQVNVYFPTCAATSVAAAEKRYDAFLAYANSQAGNGTRVYIPFDVRAGDPDCAAVLQSQ